MQEEEVEEEVDDHVVNTSAAPAEAPVSVVAGKAAPPSAAVELEAKKPAAAAADTGDISKAKLAEILALMVKKLATLKVRRARCGAPRGWGERVKPCFPGEPFA